jgi:hypothetical protein
MKVKKKKKKVNVNSKVRNMYRVNKAEIEEINF